MHFMQKLAATNFLGKLNKVESTSYMKFAKNRKAEIQSCLDCTVEFHYPKNIKNILKVSHKNSGYAPNLINL